MFVSGYKNQNIGSVTSHLDASPIGHRYALHFRNMGSSEEVLYRVTELSIEMIQDIQCIQTIIQP